MTRRSELVVIAYTLFLVCAAFCEFAHEQGWDVPSTRHNAHVAHGRDDSRDPPSAVIESSP
jgi:hypothetical protein